VRWKHVAVRVIFSWEARSCVELAGTDRSSYEPTKRDGKPKVAKRWQALYECQLYNVASTTVVFRDCGTSCHEMTAAVHMSTVCCRSLCGRLMVYARGSESELLSMRYEYGRATTVVTIVLRLY
jgi:hypothetical protein